MPGELNVDEIRDIFSQTENTPEKAFEAIGQHRPEMTPLEKRKRRESLKEKREAVEYWAKAPVDAEIIPSDRKISSDLELEPLVLGTLLSTGRWKYPFLKQYLDIEDDREAWSRFYTMGERDAELKNISNHIGRESYLDAVSQYLYEYVTSVVEKEKKFQYGKLTVGCELEIVPETEGKDELVAQSRRIEELQHVGIPITYDGIREIPLPKSLSTHEQLRAILSVIQPGLIESHQRTTLHLNIGGIKRLDSNIYLLHQMATACDLFDEQFIPGQRFHPGEHPHMAKTLYEDDPFSPAGLPFRVRKNGVIEFRGMPWVNDFVKSAKGLETFVTALEAIAAWQKVQDKDSDITERDIKLAAVWDEMKKDALGQFEDYRIPGAEYDHMYMDAEEYAIHDGLIRNRVSVFIHSGISKERGREVFKERKARRQNMYRVFRDGRAGIRKILKETAEEKV